MYGLEFSVKISRNQQFARIVRQKKQEMINIAVSWSGKTEKGLFDFHDIWESDDKHYKVSLNIGKYDRMLPMKKKANNIITIGSHLISLEV